MSEILLGYEVPSGDAVTIPLHHLVITGMTQLSGKTTTIEALIHRSGLRAIVFKTKRGEKGFETAGKTLPLYFKERSDWQYVSSLIEATLREKVRFERSWVIRACKGTHTLREVYRKVIDFLKNPKLRGLDRSVFTNLQAYLELILPEIEKLPTTDIIELGPGVNVMDLEVVYHRPEVQALVIRSVMEHILEKERDIIVVVPECWKFLPQTRNSPVKVFFERFIREGAAIGNYLWLDSQDIAGVDKTPLRQVDNWILGRQREGYEVDRTLDAIPLPKASKPTTLQIRRLKLGHFYAACGDFVKLVYVFPVGIDAELAQKVARGEVSPLVVKKMLEDIRSTKEVDEEELVYKEKFEALDKEFEAFKTKEKEFEAFKKKVDGQIELLTDERDEANSEVDRLKQENDKIAKRISGYMEQLKLLTAFEELVKAVVEPLIPDFSGLSLPSGNVTVDQPVLSIKMVRKPLELTQDDVQGRIAIVYAENLLPRGKAFPLRALKQTLEQRFGRKEAYPNLKEPLNNMVAWGFLELVKAGTRWDYRVKLLPDDAKERGLLVVNE